MKVRLSTNGSVSIATPTITVFEENNISWAMIPGNWYGNEIQYNLNMAKLTAWVFLVFRCLPKNVIR